MNVQPRRHTCWRETGRAGSVLPPCSLSYVVLLLLCCCCSTPSLLRTCAQFGAREKVTSVRFGSRFVSGYTLEGYTPSKSFPKQPQWPMLLLGHLGCMQILDWTLLDNMCLGIQLNFMKCPPHTSHPAACAPNVPPMVRWCLTVTM